MSDLTVNQIADGFSVTTTRNSPEDSPTVTWEIGGRQVLVCVECGAPKWADEECAAHSVDGNPDSEPEPAGVWMAYYSDGSGWVPFATEIEALRHALGMHMDVKFAAYGDDAWRER